MFNKLIQWKNKIETQLARLEHNDKENRKAINNIHKRNLRPLIQQEIKASDDSKVKALISPQEKKLHRLRQKGVI